MKVEYQKEFYNLYYKECYIIDEHEGNYLVYATKCFKPSIVCNYLDADGAMLGQEFFDTLEDARECFEEKKERKHGRIL